MQYEFHPIANIFPVMDGDEFDALVSDIKEHGLREPVTLFEGKVLDGRNRVLACQKLGIDPRTKEFTGTTMEAIEFVWSENRHRRHLTSGQIAAADTKRDRMTQTYQPVRQDAEKWKQATSKNAPRNGKGQLQPVGEQIPPPERESRKTRTIRAKTAGTNPKYIDLTDKLYDEDPATFEEVASGKKTPTQVQREQREEKREGRRQENAVKADQTTDILAVGAKFATILIDPPWDWGEDLGEGHHAIPFLVR